MGKQGRLLIVDIDEERSCCWEHFRPSIPPAASRNMKAFRDVFPHSVSFAVNFVAKHKRVEEENERR